MPGPPPKRSTQRRRQNKESTPDTGVARPVRPPKADPDWHAYARSWFLSLGKSGESDFYEASDWETARVAAEILSRQLNAARPSAQMVQVWASLSTALLATEGDRRRLRLELHRPAEESTSDVSDLTEFRARLTS